MLSTVLQPTAESTKASTRVVGVKSVAVCPTLPTFHGVYRVKADDSGRAV